MSNKKDKAGVWTVLGPGLLVAATGIGAGDLATASFTGSILGTAVLWAAVLGAFLKYVITEASRGGSLPLATRCSRVSCGASAGR